MESKTVTIPPFSYYGGKFYLANEIVNMFPKHICFCEVFGGSAAVLLRKDKSKVEVYNDLDSWLVNLYRVIRNKPQEFLDALEYLPYSRQERADWLKVYRAYKRTPESVDMTDVERACLFFLVLRSSFNGKVDSTSFSYSLVSSKGSSWRNSIDLIFPAHLRMREVVVENLPYYDILNRYDGKETLFYLDPPYPHDSRVSTSDYEYEMKWEDHEAFLDQICGLEGMVVLSSYHNSLYDDFLIHYNEGDNQFYYKDVDVMCGASYTEGVTQLEGKPRRTEVIYWNQAVQDRKSQLQLF